MNTQETILEVKDAHVWYPIHTGFFSKASSYVKAVNGVSFSLQKGETLGIVGESGCGKTTISRAILGLEKLHSGTISLAGIDLADTSRTSIMAKYRMMQVVFQDPFASLNPRHTILELLTEGMIAHGLATKDNRIEKAKELLDDVGMRQDCLNRYPHEFSGGQRQRVAIARALSLNPKLLICDEAVSALDLSVRAQILNLLTELKEKHDLSYLFISHDISVVRHLSDRIAVMNKGKIVEIGTTDKILNNPQDDYTKTLLSAVPKIRTK